MYQWRSSAWKSSWNWSRACAVLNIIWGKYFQYLRLKYTGGPNITAKLYCICLSEHETRAYTDAVRICGNICKICTYVLVMDTEFYPYERFGSGSNFWSFDPDHIWGKNFLCWESLQKIDKLRVPDKAGGLFPKKRFCIVQIEKYQAKVKRF